MWRVRVSGDSPRAALMGLHEGPGQKEGPHSQGSGQTVRGGCPLAGRQGEATMCLQTPEPGPQGGGWQHWLWGRFPLFSA